MESIRGRLSSMASSIQSAYIYRWMIMSRKEKKKKFSFIVNGITVSTCGGFFFFLMRIRSQEEEERDGGASGEESGAYRVQWCYRGEREQPLADAPPLLRSDWHMLDHTQPLCPIPHHFCAVAARRCVSVVAQLSSRSTASPTWLLLFCFSLPTLYR